MSNTTITLREIMIKARQESVQMQHYYIGVEHLFIALLQIHGGIASGILEANGQQPDYVIDAIRRKTDKGTDQRLWVGIPYTPRTDIIMNIANDMALDADKEDITERELLCAIFDERDSLPIRVLKSLKLDIALLADAARDFTPTRAAQPPDISISFGPAFGTADSIQREQLFLLRRMFSGYAGIRIERRLTGFRGALILVVTPVQPDDREDASIVVKIDQTDNILDEVQRYEAHVKNALPLRTARLEDMPTVPDSFNLAGIKYTLVASSGDVPQDLRDRVRDEGIDGLGQLIQKELYTQFNKTWWQQRRPFRFQAWMEYDWLLPPALLLEYRSDSEIPADSHLIRIPFNRVRLKSKLRQFQYGDVVILENFCVQKVERDNDLLKLAIGYGSEADKRAYKMEVKGLNLAHRSHYRGEIVERLVGTVVKTRHEMLEEAVRELEPDFDTRSRSIPLGNNSRAPNPLHFYEDLLDKHVNGSLSKIHGDLHLGNILVGPGQSLWLIDFAQTRDGHTLFDWTSLEISLLGDVVMPVAGDSWDTARKVLQGLSALEKRTSPDYLTHEVVAALTSVMAIREIVGQCLTEEGNWFEYYIALALCALRAITWPAMSLGGRRLMFLLSGVAILELNRKYLNSSSLDTPSPDEMERTDHLSNPVTADVGDETLSAIDASALALMEERLDAVTDKPGNPLAKTDVMANPLPDDEDHTFASPRTASFDAAEGGSEPG